MTDCLFCKVISGKIPAQKVYEDEHVFAFNDINPQAPTHILIVPKKHISTINDISHSDNALIGELFLAAQTIAKQKKINVEGFRTVMNCNERGGQTVFHIQGSLNLLEWFLQLNFHKF